MSKGIKNLLIPNVTKVPGKGAAAKSNALKEGSVSEFDKLLKSKSNNISLTSHAAKRLEQRNIDFDGEEYLKLKDAMKKLRAKGGKDSLVITDKAAYVVDVKNSKVVTAVDKMSMNDNVFTKIDSTVFMN